MVYLSHTDLFFVLQNFRRIRKEEQASYAPNRRFQDDCDPDPYLKGKHTMGPTYTKHPGNFLTSYPANLMNFVHWFPYKLSL